MPSNSRYPCQRGRNEKNESRTGFEKLKATFLEHLTHTSLISRKLPISRGSQKALADPAAIGKTGELSRRVLMWTDAAIPLAAAAWS